MAGSSLMSPQTVLPALAARLGAGNIALGAISMIAFVGVNLPQIFASRYGQTLQWKKPWVTTMGFGQRVSVLAMGLLILFAGGIAPSTVLALFILLFFFNQLFTGLSSPVWFDYYAKLTPVNRRGRLIAARNSLASTTAFAGGLVLTWLLAEFAFPVNFGLVFLIAAGLQLISIGLQLGLVEEFPSRTAPFLTMKDYLKQCRDVLRTDHRFRKFLTASAFLVLAAMPMGFYAVYGLKQFQGNETMIGEFTLIMVTGQVLGAVGIGTISDRRGNRMALLTASGALGTATLIAVAAPSLLLYRLVFLFLGVNLGSEQMVRANLALEYGAVEHRSTYIGLMNTLLAPLYGAGLLAGWLGDLAGYGAIFCTGLGFSLIGIILLLTRVTEPRPRG